ncbi:hypothetical protein AXW93_03755 [Pseudomonas aeruginosa]|nr:hypothetical protein AXW93_03755 [Pseudomonas aeruginosa]
MHTELDHLAFLFFREFARCEYCLKAVGFLDGPPSSPKAGWRAFAAEVTAVFEAPSNVEVAEAIQYFLAHPPKKQVFSEGRLVWSAIPPTSQSQAEFILLLICRVRNNLFHGGKFNGHWFEPQRSEELLTRGLVILQAVVLGHPKVRKAYKDRADQ